MSQQITVLAVGLSLVFAVMSYQDYRAAKVAADGASRLAREATLKAEELDRIYQELNGPIQHEEAR